MKTVQLRQQFIDFFKRNDHKYIVPSKVIDVDPSLFFVNSGMCQLKDTFLSKKEIDDNFAKLTNSQICIRAGGKHNDLDDVGSDSYHLTCFEMLGNWSLNSYSIDCAIGLAYDFLINECGLKHDRIYVTYFEGSDDIPEDRNTKELWLKYLPENKVIKGSFKDNFWMMSYNGICGPCTEIHYDLIGNRDASNKVNKDDPTVIEIWNIVNIQFYKIDDSFIKLEKSFIDTGMGLERLTMVLQNKHTIYLTDSLLYLLSYAQIITGADLYIDNYDPDNNISKAYRIFSDHIRTVVICLHHGLDFGSNGRNFVLKKIFRRLLTYTYLYLNNCEVKFMMTHNAIKSLVSDILDYYLERKYDVTMIINKMIYEEKIYIDKLKYIKVKYNKYKKNNKYIDIISKMKNTEGIEEIVVNNIDNLTLPK